MLKLLIYLSSYLDQETVKRPFRSSSQAASAPVTTILTTKGRSSPTNYLLLKETTSKLASLSLDYSFNVLPPAGKLLLPAFYVFWSDSTKEWTVA